MAARIGLSSPCSRTSAMGRTRRLASGPKPDIALIGPKRSLPRAVPGGKRTLGANFVTGGKPSRRVQQLEMGSDLYRAFTIALRRYSIRWPASGQRSSNGNIGPRLASCLFERGHAMVWSAISTRNETIPIVRGGWLDALRFIVAAVIVLHRFQGAGQVALAGGPPSGLRAGRIPADQLLPDRQRLCADAGRWGVGRGREDVGGRFLRQTLPAGLARAHHHGAEPRRPGPRQRRSGRRARKPEWFAKKVWIAPWVAGWAGIGAARR